VPALIINHPSYRPKLEAFMVEYPETPESIAHAKSVQQVERTRVLASVLAGFFDVDLRSCTSTIRVHYLEAAAMAMQAAARTPGL
jgi:hypothetical protein